jgi:hypothetical protein
MVAEPPYILSDRPPVPVRAGFGDRFRYLHGASGRRYLFTHIDADDLADFRSAVIVLARREPRGLRALSITELDANGSPIGAGRWPPAVPRDCIVLVHLLAERGEDRRAAVADLAAAGLARAARTVAVAKGSEIGH